MKRERPILHMPLRYVNRCGVYCDNFTDELGPLTPEQSEWWHSFGRHLEAAKGSFPKLPSRWPA